MLRYIASAVAAGAVVYEVSTLVYGALALGVALPAEQRCEASAMSAVEQMERSPRADTQGFDNVVQICQHSAGMINALVPPGIRQ
ncbi:hypothetical protein [Paraburkholderia kururiensis]|jgi:hypothetical protein|uniref:hypothetical protein n=1 Tax=Paraburkholderia kururiensis TaxID=984307 RepID=UPI0018F53D54|nr:hypothetical protein [Paraburkholderia kururiensis]